MENDTTSLASQTQEASITPDIKTPERTLSASQTREASIQTDKIIISKDNELERYCLETANYSTHSTSTTSTTRSTRSTSSTRSPVSPSISTTQPELAEIKMDVGVARIPALTLEEKKAAQSENEQNFTVMEINKIIGYITSGKSFQTNRNIIVSPITRIDGSMRPELMWTMCGSSYLWIPDGQYHEYDYVMGKLPTVDCISAMILASTMQRIGAAWQQSLLNQIVVID